jgi:hypothetical protein
MLIIENKTEPDITWRNKYAISVPVNWGKNTNMVLIFVY